MSKKVMAIAACLTLLTLTLAACQAPAAEEPAEEVEMTAPPEEAEGEQLCSGLNLIFFPGGSEGGPFATVVYNGARAAERDLGADVEYVWSDWNPEQMVRQFREVIATNPDGIAIMGHPGDDAYEAAVDEAYEKGIVVTSQNTTLPRLEARYKSQGFGYVGQELYESGYMLGSAAVERSGLGDGDRAMVWGLRSEPTRGQRTIGVIDALEEAGMEVDYIEIDSATDADATAGTSVFTGYVSSHPDVKLICTDHGALTATSETYLNAANKNPDDIYFIGFDLSPATLEAIRGGWTDLVLDQQPYLQGYLPIVQLCMSIKYQFSGLHIDTGSGLVHKDNVEALAPLVEEQIR